MRLDVYIFGVLLLTSIATAEAPTDKVQPTRAEQYQAEFDAYKERLAASSDPDDQSLAMQFLVKSAEPGALSEAGRRWALSNPGEQAVKLMAAITCQWSADTPQRAVCDEHRLLQRWQQSEPTNAYVWTLAAVRADAEGNLAEFERSSARLLASDRFDTGFTTAMQLMRTSMARDPHYGQRPAGERAVANWGVAMAIPMPTILEICPTGRSAPIRLDRSELCRHLAKLMTDHGSEVSNAMIGAIVAQAYALDELERAAIVETQANQQALMTQLRLDPRLDAAIDIEAGVFLDSLDQFTQMVIAEGEMKAMVSWLAAAPPAGSPSATPIGQ